jgi:hypothetical protein
VENELSAVLNINGLSAAAGFSGRWIEFIQAMVSVLKRGEYTSWAFHRDDAGSNMDLDILRDLELLLRVDVQHLEKPLAVEKWRDLEVREVDITAKEIRCEAELCALAGINLGAQALVHQDVPLMLFELFNLEGDLTYRCFKFRYYITIKSFVILGISKRHLFSWLEAKYRAKLCSSAAPTAAPSFRAC